ncbi:hypothetical protein Tco_0047755, partial [Tanacetum coccineum]
MNQNFYEPNLCYKSISSSFDQFQPPQFPVMSIQDMEDLKQQYLDEMKSLINIKDYRNENIDIEIKINEIKENFNGMSIEINKKKKLQQLDEIYKSSLTVITPNSSIKNSLIMGDEHLDTIPETESDEENESSVEDLNLTLSESEDLSEDLSDIESECDMPVCDYFTTFSNPLFDSNDNFISSDDKSLSDEDVPEE